MEIRQKNNAAIPAVQNRLNSRVESSTTVFT